MKKYLLYLDESGVANLVNRQERYFILAGLAVEEKVDQEISAYFSYIKRRYGIEGDKNFHAVEFFEKKSTDIYLTASQAKQFCGSLSELIKTIPLEPFVFAVEKKQLAVLLKLPKNYGFKGSNSHKEDKDFPYELLARKIFLSFGGFLKKKHAHGAVIAESRRGSDRVLIRAHLDAQEPGLYIGPKSKTYHRNSKEFRDRVVSLTFENKAGLRGGLELADVYAYVVYQKLNKKLPLYKGRGIDLLWKSIEMQLKDEKSKLGLLLPNTVSVVLAKDRIDKITEVVLNRMRQNSDLLQ